MELGGAGHPVKLHGLQCVGFVPPRPIGKSHYHLAPWASGTDTAYLPTVMTWEALENGLARYREPLFAYPEDRLQRMFNYLRGELSWIWAERRETVYADAVQLLTLDKSPGYPYYYSSDTKYLALQRDGLVIKNRVEAILVGEEVPCFFSLTLKDELRLAEKVLAGKTRVFSASDLHHLLASKVLFSWQNQRLVDTLGSHPITIGISVPGPGYVRAVLSLGEKCYDADGEGWDSRFNLGVARVIRDLRASFLSENRRKAVHHLYNSVYCGVAVSEGAVYRVYHNKSGWENTGHDNSLYMWAVLYDAVEDLTGQKFSEVCRCLINGDDLAISLASERVGIKELSDYLRRFNVVLSFDEPLPRAPFEITYLSHHLREIFHRSCGQVVVAAGNLPKLLSSVNWVRMSPDLSFEESCLVHLLGIRLCLFPWPVEFDKVEELIEAFVRGLVWTPRLQQFMKARIPYEQILVLHTRLEAGYFFTSSNFQVGNVTLEDLIKLQSGVMARNRKKAKVNVQAKPTAAQRAAQSARDKALARSQGGNVPRPLPRVRARNNVLSAPVASARLMKTGQPILESSSVAGDARIRVRHREYLADITGAASFTNQQFPINPGMNVTFPWLASVAQNFEKYLFRSLQFEYEPRSSTANAGSIMAAIDYDAADAAPVDKTQFMAQHGAVSSATWEECCFVADRMSLSSQGQGGSRYIREGTLASNLDIKTYDTGVFNIASQGGPGSDVGELYVSYDVELMTPSLEVASNPLSAKVTAGGSVSKTAFFGSAPVVAGLLPLSVSATTLTFNSVGQYLVESSFQGTGLNDVTLTGTASSTLLATSTNAASTALLESFSVNVTQPGQTVIVDATGSTTVTASINRISQYQTSLA